MHWAVILAGGSGSRFWPLSTPDHPKQFLPLLAEGSTAEETLSRLEGLVPRERTLIVTGPRLARTFLERFGWPEENLLIEPRAASTAPALVWATHEAHQRDRDADVLSLHADWHVSDADAFRRTARQALEVAREAGGLVTVGIVPTRVETGYGYIVPGDPATGGAFRVSRFTEKPTAAVAGDLLARGALWNSGLFAWTAAVLLRQVATATPELGPHLPRLDAGDVEGFFAAVTPVSIDVGLLERSADVLVVPGRFAWDDIGTWQALARIRQLDRAGNLLIGPGALTGASSCIAWSDGPAIVATGVKDLVIVAANGRVLVMPRDRAAELKDILDHLPATIRDLPA